MRYRKKPVEIEAIQVVKDSKGIVRVNECPDWWSDEVNARTIGNHVDSEGYVDGYLISTLEGAMLASAGDYVIRGVKGELYPCKPDIFEQTYETVEYAGNSEIEPCDIKRPEGEEIIRCRDCNKSRDGGWKCTRFSEEFYDIELEAGEIVMANVSPNGFCAWGGA